MGFYHIWAWRPFLSCDLDTLYTHWLPFPIDASHKIWLSLAKQFLRRHLNIMEIIHVYCPGAPEVQFFSESLIFSPTAHFLQDFHFK